MNIKEKEIRRMVEEANRLSKKGEGAGAMDLLDKAWRKVDHVYYFHSKSLKGLICHYIGRVWQSIEEYERVVEELARAIEFRENDPIAKAYSVFQLFICKVYGKLLITDEEVRDTKMALTAAMADKAATIADIGNMTQDLAYVEQVRGTTEKAVIFYKMTLAAREEAEDARGYALTQARLAECYKEIGEDAKAKKYGKSALEYFEKTGDVERVKQVKAVFGWE